jgi:xanthine dehydrogenase accessory factor
MSEIHGKIVELCRDNQKAVLASIIRLSGSGPRGVGTKFLVYGDHRFVGTIGGGSLEARVLIGAGKVLESGLPARLRFILKGADVEATEMICGGDVEVFLEPIFPDEANRRFFEEVEGVQKRGGAGLMATLVSTGPWEEALGRGAPPRLFLEKGGRSTGSLPRLREMEPALLAQMEELLKRRKPALLNYTDEDGRGLELLVEPVTADPTLYVFGGGHVSACIVPLASSVGFKVVVVDDRAEFADPARFPDAREVLRMDFEGAVSRLPVNQASYLVIVTRGHSHDNTVLEQCLRTDAGYIGMIGSRRKKRLVYDRMLQVGFTEADLARVHSPIGLAIGAETPEEIAVSIVAELIQVRAGEGEVKKDASL